MNSILKKKKVDTNGLFGHSDDFQVLTQLQIGSRPVPSVAGKLHCAKNSPTKTGGNLIHSTPTLPLSHRHFSFSLLSSRSPPPITVTAMSTGARKRPPPPSQPSPSTQPKSQALSQEDDFVDEDVFLDETLISEDEESLILRDIEQRQALAFRLSKWTRPPLSHDYLSQSRSVRE